MKVRGSIVQGLLTVKEIRSKNQRNGEKKKLLKDQYRHQILDINVEEAFERLNQKRQYKEVNIEKKENKRNILLSIIIPAYNASATISKCLDSVIMQKTNFTFEVICINDGSKDNTKEILEKYQKKYLNVKLKTTINQGLAAARNEGMKIANGRYFFFLDSDDFLPENAISMIMEDAKRTGAKIILGKVEKYMQKFNCITYSKKKESKIENNLITASNYVAGTAWGKLYDSELWDKIQFFDGYAFEDTIIFLDIYPQCNKFFLEGDAVYCFRSSNNSLFKKQKGSSEAIDSLWIVLKAVELAKNLKINIYSNEYYKLVLWHLSAIMRSRMLAVESVETLKDAFVVAAEFVCKEFVGKRKYEFSGDDSEIYNTLQESFIKKDFGAWEQCSKAF